MSEKDKNIYITRTNNTEISGLFTYIVNEKLVYDTRLLDDHYLLQSGNKSSDNKEILGVVCSREENVMEKINERLYGCVRKYAQEEKKRIESDGLLKFVRSGGRPQRVDIIEYF